MKELLTAVSQITEQFTHETGSPTTLFLLANLLKHNWYICYKRLIGNVFRTENVMNDSGNFRKQQSPAGTQRVHFLFVAIALRSLFPNRKVGMPSTAR